MAHSILVVDDNEDAATALVILLREAGYRVDAVNSGQAALRSIVRERPDLVLLDLGMPEMNGYEVAARIRLDPAFNAIKLVALTGWGQQSDRDKTAQVGFDAHSVKPAGTAQINVLLHRWFDRTDDGGDKGSDTAA